MLITAGIYVLALFSVMSGQVFLFSALFTIFAIYFICKNLFPVKHVVIWLLVFYFGVFNTSLRLREVDDLLSLAPVNSQIAGTIVSIPQGKSEGNPKFFFKVSNIKFNSVEKKFNDEKVLVTLNPGSADEKTIKDLKPYDFCIMEGRLSVPFKAGNPSQFDYGNYLRNYNTYVVFYANNLEKIDKSLSGKAKFMQSINSYRERIITAHSKYLVSPNLEVLGGIVFGEDAVSPPQNIKQSFINSGLLHILAASGMNVAFIYGFFFLLISLFRVKFKIRVILGMIMVVIYSLMTGLGASVIRATCMLLFVLAGKLIDRDAHSISLLSFVALLMLLYNPLWVNDVGFQLSFIVTFGILIMAPAFVRANRIKDFIISSVMIPIIAQLWVIPIQIFYFNNISLYSVFANIMSVPILMILSFGGFISSLLSAVTLISDFICRIFDTVLNPLITVLINISDFWGKLPNSALQTTHPSVFQIVLYYGILLSLSVLLYKDLREKYFKKSLLSAGILLIIWFITLIPISNRSLEITAFDVGNADCFLIKTPENKYIMIDTGKTGYNGGKSQAEIIVLKYFKDLGIKKVESIIVTHFDNDHCGGAVDLLNGLKVKNLYVNDVKHDSEIAQNIYKSAHNNNTNLILAENNQSVYDKNGIKLINYINTGNREDNENSIINLLEYNDFKMLFTGDAGVDGINYVLKNIPKNITVLKAPHHGSVHGLNKGIVDHLNPKYSLISTGENIFGHPAVYTLELLKNTKILRTDVENSVRFRVDNNGVRVYSYDTAGRKYVKIKI